MLRPTRFWVFCLLITVIEAATFTITASGFASITIGVPFTITWTGASGPVTLLLKNGPSTSLTTVETIASGLSGTSYIWTPSTSLVSGTYAFEIDDGTTLDYSVQFQIEGSSAASTTSSTTTSTTATPTSSTPSSTTTSISSTTTTSISSAPTSSTQSSTTSLTSSPSSSASGTSFTSTSASSTSSFSSSSTSSPQSSSSSKSGLSTGAKAGIGVGAALGALLIIGLIIFAFWYGRRSASKKPKSDTEDTLGKAELEPGRVMPKELDGTPLSEEEKKELERRRRAAELEGVTPISLVEIGGGQKVSERAELEALRGEARGVHEMG